MTATEGTSLHLRDVRAGYGEGTVVHGVSMSLRPGRLSVLVGRNGAGKSTLLRAISGLLSLQGGSVELGDEDITGVAPRERVRRGLLHVQEGRRLFRQQSVLANLQVAHFGVGGARQDEDERIHEAFEVFPILRARAQLTAGLLSGGQQQMLAIAQALVARPRVLMLDEPSLGLAPQLVDDVFSTIEDLRARGTTILLVEQMVDQALAIADDVFVMRTGLIHASGSPDDSDLRAAVEEAYVGGGSHVDAPGESTN